MQEVCFAFATGPTHFPACVLKVWTPLRPWHLKCKLHFSFKQQLCRKQPVMLIPVDNFRSKLSKLPSLCNSLPGRQKKDCGQYLTHHSLQILPPVSTSAVPTGGKGKWALHPLPINFSWCKVTVLRAEIRLMCRFLCGDPSKSYSCNPCKSCCCLENF